MFYPKLAKIGLILVIIPKPLPNKDDPFSLLKPEYSERMTLTQWQLMAWILAPPSLQKPWYAASKVITVHKTGFQTLAQCHFRNGIENLNLFLLPQVNSVPEWLAFDAIFNDLKFYVKTTNKYLIQLQMNSIWLTRQTFYSIAYKGAITIIPRNMQVLPPMWSGWLSPILQ